MVLYSGTLDQSVLPVGLTIYPRQGARFARTLPWFDKKVNPLTYPLLFPLGTPGWTYHSIPYVKPLDFLIRLQQVYDARKTWDGDIPPEIIR